MQEHDSNSAAESTPPEPQAMDVGEFARNVQHAAMHGAYQGVVRGAITVALLFAAVEMAVVTVRIIRNRQKGA